MDKLKLGRYFISRSGRFNGTILLYNKAEWPNLELKARPKQVFDYFLFDN